MSILTKKKHLFPPVQGMGNSGSVARALLAEHTWSQIWRGTVHKPADIVLACQFVFCFDGLNDWFDPYYCLRFSNADNKKDIYNVLVTQE